MAFYIRKAIRVGPFRFNLSKSGVGVSAGVKGLRLGAGPRGNYVHMGRGGLYYRKTLPAGLRERRQPINEPAFDNYDERELLHEPISTGHGPLEEIKSANISQMIDSTSASLVQEINDNRQKLPIWPFVVAAGVFFSLLALIKIQFPILTFLIVIVSVIGVIFAVVKDSLRRTTVLFFDLEPEIEAAYQKLHDTFIKMSSSSRAWHIKAEGAVYDQKRHAGAGTILQRNLITLSIKSPPHVETNIPTPCISLGEKDLYFFPDKVLVFDSNNVGAVGYPNLQVSVEATRFIETEKVPLDAQVVDYTWQYVNKRGGPDRRFNDNYEIPIALYEDILFTSITGLNERIELSRVGFGGGFAGAIRKLAGSFK